MKPYTITERHARASTVADYGKLYRGDYMRGNWSWRASGLDPLLGGASRVVEVGAGRGQLAKLMQSRGLEWQAFDPHPTTPWVEHASLPNLPCGDRSFDLSVTVDVLEHIAPSDILRCLAELRRVARRGAWAIANMSDVHLVDGVPTELHLIQHPAPWWVDQIRSIGGVARVHKTDTPIRFWLEVSW